jgi:hypothetical protein
MAESLNTDDDAKPHNLTAEEYEALHVQRAEELGPNGLHVVPQPFLDHINSQIAGNA